MYNKIYEKKEYIIFKVKQGFVIYNTKKDFQEGHTHIRNFNAAKTAIDLVSNHKIPKSTDKYYLVSLIRLSNDEKYIEKIEELIEVRESKGSKQNYYNSSSKSMKRSG